MCAFADGRVAKSRPSRRRARCAARGEHDDRAAGRGGHAARHAPEQRGRRRPVAAGAADEQVGVARGDEEHVRRVADLHVDVDRLAEQPGGRGLGGLLRAEAEVVVVAGARLDRRRARAAGAPARRARPVRARTAARPSAVATNPTQNERRRPPSRVARRASGRARPRAAARRSRRERPASRPGGPRRADRPQDRRRHRGRTRRPPPAARRPSRRHRREADGRGVERHRVQRGEDRGHREWF